MKHIMQHPARLITFLLIAGTIGLLFLMHAHSTNEAACMQSNPGSSIIKLI